MALGKCDISRLTGGISSCERFDIFTVFDNLAIDVCNGVAISVDHVSAAVFTDLNTSYNIIQKLRIRDKDNAACDLAVQAAVFPYRRCDYDHKLTGKSRHGGLGDCYLTFHCILEVLPVRIVVAVEAVAVGFN